MEIKKTLEGTTLTMQIFGRIDAVTAIDLDKDFAKLPPEVNEVIMDFAGVEYIASAGLRILLKAQRKMDARGNMKIRNVRPEVRDVLDMTGFTDFLTIDEDKKKTFSVSF